MTGPLYVIVGPPASGKSSAAAALAKSYDAGVHIPVDDLRHMVVAGIVEPEPEWRPQLADQVRMARESALDIAARYRAAGFAVVIDDFVDPHLLTEYVQLAQDPGALRVVLTPPVEVALARNRVRGGSEDYIAYLDVGIRLVSDLVVEHRDELQADGWEMVDNADLTVEQTVEVIRSQLRDED
jgi:predicted kinase